MFRLFSIIVFKLNGWKIDCDPNLINSYKKYIIICAPHTSNWDAVYFTAAANKLKLKIKFLIKKEWIRFPFNLIFKPLGAIAINKKIKDKANTVNYLTTLFNIKQELIIAIAPEGTRGYNPYWKTGFYHTAIQANVPILLGYLDYKKKIAGIFKAFIPTGDILKDLNYISDFYINKTGKNPELFSPFKTNPLKDSK